MDWNKLPRWFLVSVIILLVAIAGPVMTYSVNNHLNTDVQQSQDIKDLTKAVAGLVEATENLKTVTENNKAEHRWLHRND